MTDSEYFLKSTGLCLTFKDITGVDTQDTEYKVILTYIHLQMSIKKKLNKDKAILNQKPKG